MHFPKELLASTLKIKEKGGQISDDDWEVLLGHLEQALHPHLSQIANKPLGDINLLDCTSGNTLKNEIKSDDIRCGSILNPIKMPGLWFPAILLPRKEGEKTDHVFIWGITRNDDWALVKVICNLRYEAVTSDDPMTIFDFDVESMSIGFSWQLEISQKCGITLEQMYQQILKAVSDWAQRRRKLADEAEGFNTGLKIIDAILRGQ